VKKHGGWEGEIVDGDTNFVPLVVMPDTGLPTGIITNFDIIERGRKMFEHLQPHVYPAGLITVADVQLLEGMADFAKKLPQGPRDDRSMMKLLAGWRRAVVAEGDSSLQIFLHRRGFPLPLSDHILSNARKVTRLLDGPLPACDSFESSDLSLEFLNTAFQCRPGGLSDRGNRRRMR